MKLSSLGALDLRAHVPTLEEAIDEIERLRTICQDIIEVIGTEYAQGADADFCLHEIDVIAHRYFEP